MPEMVRAHNLYYLDNFEGKQVQLRAAVFVLSAGDRNSAPERLSRHHENPRHRLQRPDRLRSGRVLRRARDIRFTASTTTCAPISSVRRATRAGISAGCASVTRLSRITNSTSATAPRCFDCLRNGAPTADRPLRRAAEPRPGRARPFDDFDVNAVGTLNLLEATRQHAPEARVRLHEHEQGLRRRAQRTAARGAGDALGLRRSG